MYKHFWVSAVITLMAQIVGSAIFHWIYSQEIYYSDFTHGDSFLVCHLTLRDFMRNIILHGRVRYTINHQLAKFHGHRSYQRGHVTLLVYHVTTNNQIVRGSCDSTGGFLSISPQPAMFGGHRLCERGNICHVTSRNHVSEDHLTGWVSFPHHKLPLCQVWWPSTLQKRRYFVFDSSRDLM